MFYFLIAISVFFSSFAYSEQPTNVNPLIAKRHSGRFFDPQKAVTKDQLFSLVQAARWSASNYNDQPWNFIICDRNLNQAAYNTALNSLVKENQEWAKNAPVLIIVVAKNVSDYTKEPNRHSQYDTGGAATQMSLQAVALNLMAHQMGGFDANKILQNFNIPQGFTPMAIMAVGYEMQNPADANAPRERYPINQNFFMDDWGNAFN